MVNPLIHYLVLLLLPVPPLYWKELMIISIMPPAVMNTVIARIYKWYPELVASITFVLTLVSLVLVSIIAFIVL